MQERLLELWKKIQEWWKALTVKQRTLIVSAIAVIVLAFVILGTVLSRPQYTVLANCESTKEASEITALLDGDGIDYTVSTDGLEIRVVTSQLSQANLLLGANNILASGYGIDNVTNGSFSTTESDKQKKYKLYLESHLEEDFIKKFSAIKSANVQLNIPDNNGTLISSNEQSHAAILLELDGEFTTDNAAFLAKAVATALGNDTTENITIMDTDGNMLYSGEDEFSLGGSASSQLSVKQQAEALVASEVKKVLQGTNGFDNIEVASNLTIDFSTTTQTDHNYTSDENSTQGLFAESSIYSSDSTAGGGAVPGTDSNTEGTTYQIQDNTEQSTSTTEETHKYLPNESIIEKNTPAGAIQYANSSVAVTAIDYTVIKQEDARSQGLLDGVTWEEYKAANSDRTKMDVDPDLVDVVSKATGIASENISIVAYSENWFVDKEGLGIGTSDIVVIVLIALILGLLAFVILRSMMREKKPQQEEEELSVESLLQSNPEVELEDIELESKSETRKMIEKFVDENPEAVANLLRNWLNEDWG